MEPQSQKVSSKVFQNPVLNLLTKSNLIIHVFTYGSVLAFLLSQNRVLNALSAWVYLSGIFVWTLKEYLIHRYLFHIPAKRFQYIIHGIHHQFPKDKQRLLMPPVPGLLIIVFLFSFWYFIIGEFVYVFLSGILTGYLGYTFIHYIVHAYKPIKGVKFLWSHHLKHHNPKYEHQAFGVSSPLWDYIFGTMPK